MRRQLITDLVAPSQVRFVWYAGLKPASDFIGEFASICKNFVCQLIIQPGIAPTMRRPQTISSFREHLALVHFVLADQPRSGSFQHGAGLKLALISLEKFPSIFKTAIFGCLNLILQPGTRDTTSRMYYGHVS
jgi:hypothetical protein